MSYTKAPMYLSDQEFMAMAQKMNAALGPLLQNPPAPGRKRRIFTTIVLPAPDKPPDET